MKWKLSNSVNLQIDELATDLDCDRADLQDKFDKECRKSAEWAESETAGDIAEWLNAILGLVDALEDLDKTPTE